MKNFKFVLIALVSLVMVSVSCTKDDGEDTNPETGDLKTADVILSRKTAYGNDWIYYSFAEGKEVDSTNHASSLTWDIAFNRYNVRTNGGETGSGQGAAYDAGEVDFTSVLEANESGYTVDDTIQIVEAFTGQGVTYMTTTGNDVFKECVAMVHGNMGPSYETNDHVYVVKTANGKYAKVWIKGYYSEGGESGFINMKYTYQAGEGRKFE